MAPEYITGGKVVGKSELEDGAGGDTYDRKNFYIRSTDANGNRDSVRIETGKFPPFLSALSTKWINDERTPYRSMADLVRDAVAHRLHQLEEMSNSGSFPWTPFETANRLALAAAEARDMREQTESFQNGITEAIASGDFYWLQDLLDLAKKAVQQMREPYKSQVEKIIKPYLDGTIRLARPSE